MVTSTGIKNFKLGNSLFNLATVIGIAEANNDVVVLPDNYRFVPFFNIPKEWLKSDISFIVEESEGPFHYTNIPYTKDMNIVGYFQSEKYFEHAKDKVREIISVTEDVKKGIQDQINIIKSEYTIALHVRRDDYLNYPNIHPTQDYNYYKKALEYIVNKTQRNDIEVFVFSDDIQWCVHNLFSLAQTNGIKKVNFVSDNENYEDLHLMSLCNHQVIANSSFSWWGAWLNTYKDKIVVAPNNWFGPQGPDPKDLVPETWKRI
jgi:hypothetical protein